MALTQLCVKKVNIKKTSVVCYLPCSNGTHIVRKRLIGCCLVFVTLKNHDVKDVVVHKFGFD
jgi:hypothetical protein